MADSDFISVPERVCGSYHRYRWPQPIGLYARFGATIHGREAVSVAP